MYLLRNKTSLMMLFHIKGKSLCLDFMVEATKNNKAIKATN